MKLLKHPRGGMKKFYLFVFLCLFFTSAKVFSEDIAALDSAQGKVESKSPGASTWTKASSGDHFQPQDSVRTGTNSRAGLLFFNGVLVRLNENSAIEFKENSKESGSLPLRITSGTTYFFSREPQQFPEIETPVVSAAVRGTEFVIEVKEDETVISVMDGTVECRNEKGALTLRNGEQAVVTQGQAPVKQILVRPLDTVQWALYYPAVLDFSDDALRGSPHELTQAITAYNQGNLDDAFRILDGTGDPKPLLIEVYEASLYLSVGQIQKAKESLAQIQNLEKGPSDLASMCYALQSIIALVNNQKEEALALAQKAIEANPNSGSAALAMSYALQAHFELDEAMRWTKETIRLSPNSGPARARLAELELGFGKINQATHTMEEALHIAPHDARVLTVAGFVYLTRYDTKKAIAYFDQAIALENWNGLPHLGRGLAWIRQNKLNEGLRDVEIAVHLDPGVALYRSYLGKTFFEEKRDKLAAHEYDIAKNLDPRDPTPYLYDAFNKLAHTRPVEALWSIEDSIKLNNNRAVYRSRMLLDQDQAVRSAGLSQAFTSVGFGEAARIESIKSMNRDYSNYSAHLLLAGSYIDTPRLALASISELLITRLLVPLSFNPVDPSIRGEASFNEYASLFDRQRGRVFLDGSARSDDDFISGRVLHSMLTEKSAYILSYFPDYTKGYRENDWERSQSVLFFTQTQLSYNDTLSFETIFGKDKSGDTGINFDPNSNDVNRDSEFTNITHRFGYHHRFGPESHFIGQFIYNDREITLEDISPRLFTLNTFKGTSLTSSSLDSITSNQFQNERFNSLKGDGQFIWDTPVVSVVAGAGAFDSDTHDNETGKAAFDQLGFLNGIELFSSNAISEQAQHVYTYTTWHLAEWVDTFAAANYSRLELSQSVPPPFIEGTQIVDEIDPKCGLAFYITPSTTLRTAYFETLGPSSIADLESIEPTQIAGFNQLVDELPGNKSKSYGLGIDQKFAKRTYLGVEALHRNIEQSLGFSSDIVNLNSDAGLVSGENSPVEFLHQEARENLLNAYFYQIFHKTLTGTLDYTIAHLEDKFSLKESQTHRIKIGLNYFHPSGWFARTSATWRNQDLEDFGSTVDGVRDFWIVDASVGYQLPKRFGVVILSVTNILDEDFLYEPIGLDSRFLPDRSVNLRVSLNF